MKINTDNLVVDINKVFPNDYNPKLNFRDVPKNLEEFEKVKESIKQFGQVQPIIVREFKDGYEIINGYHRWEAMKELGFDEIEIKNLGKIDFDTAVSRALLTEDTKVPIDTIELSYLIKKLITDDKDVDYWAKLLPYSSDEILKKVELMDYDGFNETDFTGEEDTREAGLMSVNIDFHFESEEELDKVKDYFDTLKDEEKEIGLLNLIRED